MLKATKVRLYPTVRQAQFLNEQFGAVRFCYNKTVYLKSRFYKKKGVSLSVIKEIKPLLSVAKRSRKYEWLAKYDSVSLNEAVRHADTAFNRFFKKTGRYPRFKSKRSNQSSYHCQSIKVGDDWIKIPKLDPIKAVIHRPIVGKIRSITVSKDRLGTFYASILCEDGQETPEPIQAVEESRVVGIDVGIARFLTESSGKVVANPRELKLARQKLRKAHKAVSRKQKGSHRRAKAIKRLARVYREVTRKREDFQHKVSRRLIDENQAVIVESLKIKNMMRNHHLAEAIADVGWYGFLNKLEYKAKASGKLFVQIDTFYPSSKTCPHCLQKFDGLKLSMREWTCPHCGRLNDRDLAAAVNLKREGITYLKAEGHSVLRR